MIIPHNYKPTLRQIFDFGLEIVEKDKYTISKSKEYATKRYSKRYNKQIIIYVAIIMYNYSRIDVAEYLKISPSAVSSSLYKFKNSRTKEDLTDELYESLEFLYGKEMEKSLEAYSAKLLPIFANEMNFTTRSVGDLNKLEKWLINRLYEIENK